LFVFGFLYWVNLNYGLFMDELLRIQGLEGGLLQDLFDASGEAQRRLEAARKSRADVMSGARAKARGEGEGMLLAAEDRASSEAEGIVARARADAVALRGKSVERSVKVFERILVEFGV
jgi:vacuolar-type H+-ATPase subunit H